MIENENIEKAIQAIENGESSLIYRRMVADTETPVSASLKLMKPGRGDFLLESVEGGETRGRHSLIGIAPDLMFRGIGDRCEINRHWAHDQNYFLPLDGNPLARLRELRAECMMDVPSELPDALACLVGYFGYETIGLVEKLPRTHASELDIPDMIFMRPTVVVIFDRLKDEMFLVAPIWAGNDRTIEDCLEQVNGKLDETERTLSQPLDNKLYQCQVSSAPREKEEAQLTPILPVGRYAEMVRAAKDYIVAGDIFQVVLAQRFTTPFSLPPFNLYRALRRINPSPFLYFLDLPGFALIGSSPEILVRLRGDEVTIRPIAGTRSRGANAAEDQANKASLLADAKERAEHLMLLDLGRNDVGRVAEQTTVTVTDSYMVEFYSHVMHIVSNVTGRLKRGMDAVDALFAGFPAGTVSGAPKLRACEIIAELEHETRGAYAGGVGYFSPTGNMDSCIVLRTAVVKDGVMHVQAGAGIVIDSDAAYEQRECEAKASALLAAAQEAVRLAMNIEFGQ